VLSVEGQDRTLGERIARHIYVRKINGDTGATAPGVPETEAAPDPGPATGEHGAGAVKKNGGNAAARPQKEGTKR